MQGEKERSTSYAPILDTIEKKFGSLTKEERCVFSELEFLLTRQRLQTKILVPGAGLARLAFDIARMGFSSQGGWSHSYFPV